MIGELHNQEQVTLSGGNGCKLFLGKEKEHLVDVSLISWERNQQGEVWGLMVIDEDAPNLEEAEVVIQVRSDAHFPPHFAEIRMRNFSAMTEIEPSKTFPFIARGIEKVYEI